MSNNLKQIVLIGFLASVCLSAQTASAAVFAMTKCSKPESSQPNCRDVRGCDRGCDRGCNGKNGCKTGCEGAQADALSREEALAEIQTEKKSAAKKVLEEM